MLAPPSVGFWFVLVVGAAFTFLPIIIALYREANRQYGDNEKIDKRGPISYGLFAALCTVLLIHCFGDSRVLSWLYETPDRSDPTGWRSLIVPFGPVFFLLVIAELVVAFFAIRHKQGLWATGSLFLTLFLIQFITGVPVFPWIFSNKILSLTLLGSYVILGVLWSFFYKWDRLVSDHRARYDIVRADWLKTRGLTESSDFTLEDKLDWEKYFEKHKTDEDGVIEARPKYRDHKSELLGWATMWPVSVFETFVFDWLSDIFYRVYRRLGTVLEWIMVRRWKGTETHMLTPEERAALEDEQKRRNEKVQA